MRFNEITKKAVLAAMEDAGEIDSRLVDAQQARRIIDRLVGYEVSDLLWKKIWRGLSAGRVQTVTLRIICERPVKQILAGGQSHSYRIRLETGQFFEVVVVQQGIDVIAIRCSCASASVRRKRGARCGSRT